MKKYSTGLVLLLAILGAIYTLGNARDKTMKHAKLAFSTVNLTLPKISLRAVVVHQAQNMTDAEVTISGDENDALTNPIHAIIKLRALAEAWRDESQLRDIADKGVAPAYFMPLSPGKQTLPNRLYYQALPSMALYFATYEASDVALPLVGALHCTFDLEGGGFNYGQVLLRDLPAKDIKTVLKSICSSLGKAL